MFLNLQNAAEAEFLIELSGNAYITLDMNDEDVNGKWTTGGPETERKLHCCETYN